MKSFMQNVTYRVLYRKFFTYNLDLLEEIKYICKTISTNPIPYRPNSALFLVSINSSFKLQTFDQIDLIYNSLQHVH
jgi:hypothetical protein